MPNSPVTKIAEVCLCIDTHLDSHDPASTPDRAPLKRLLSALGSALDACGSQESAIGEEPAAAVAQVAVRLLTYFDGTDRHSCGRILEAEACRLLEVLALRGHMLQDALPVVVGLLSQYSRWQRLQFGALQAVCQGASTVATLARLGMAGGEEQLTKAANLLSQILFSVEDLQACAAVAGALGALACCGEALQGHILQSGAVDRIRCLLSASSDDSQACCRLAGAAQQIRSAEEEDTSCGKQAGIEAGPAARTRSKRPADQPAAAQLPTGREAVDSSNAQARAKRSKGRRAGVGGAKKAAAKKSRPASTAAGSGGHHGLPLPGASSDAALAPREGNVARPTRVQPPRRAKALRKGQENLQASAAHAEPQKKPAGGPRRRRG